MSAPPQQTVLLPTGARRSRASHALIPEQPLAVVRAVRDWTRRF